MDYMAVIAYTVCPGLFVVECDIAVIALFYVYFYWTGRNYDDRQYTDLGPHMHVAQI